MCNEELPEFTEQVFEFDHLNEPQTDDNVIPITNQAPKSEPDKTLELLALASKLIDEAAYIQAQQRPGSESTQLFLIAASLETEIKRITSWN